jgi:superfamily II DNA or RNA helicase
MMPFAVGSLVKARGREWVVLPDSQDDLLMVRPLGGMEDEVTGICTSLESVEPAAFRLPDPEHLGDFRSCRLLRDAVRLGFRSSAGPFRSFGRIAVEPRPYQLVPLLMALKLDPVRLLIADDVGIGKTVEACLVARELLDRGEISRLAVLCPPHLAEQWQGELRDKFHIQAELVLPSTARRLEAPCATGQSLFDIHPFVVVSLDFIKSESRREEFIRSCPECVIVDEAHSCAAGFESRGQKHQRHLLVKRLSDKKDRHLVLVTATPHSGNENAFRSLVELLKPEFADLPEDLRGEANEAHRQRLAQHLIQRLRNDITAYMGTNTTFPVREEAEETYELSPEYRQFLKDVLAYARETVKGTKDDSFHQRVRWWAALALLRSISSSPAAAAATLRNRASPADGSTVQEADEIGAHAILDVDPEESLEGTDVSIGADADDKAKDPPANKKKLLEFAKRAETLRGEKDAKLINAVAHVQALLKDGYSPIVFCRFIQTAIYVAEQLRDRLKVKNVEVSAVTGELPPEEREQRIQQLAKHEKRVLVCTDCLSEGVNLQHQFNAVMHYDLSWNPTRHEQRAGRVDRYGQRNKTVRVLTYYGRDNPMDGIILEVLLRKHKTIRGKLGISVSMPTDSKRVMQALMEGLLLRGKDNQTGYLDFMYDGYEEEKKALHTGWEAAAERRSRTIFSQQSIKVEEVAQELESVRAAIGSGVDVERFVRETVAAHKGVATHGSDGSVRLDLRELKRSLADALGAQNDQLTARFELPVAEDEIYLSRTHPMVEGLAGYVMESALDNLEDAAARRCGVTRSAKVKTRTTLLLVRYRFHILINRPEGQQALLAEDCQLLGFESSPEQAKWLDRETAGKLLELAPEGNVPPEMARSYLLPVVQGYDHLRPHLEKVAQERGKEILDAHIRVRAASRVRNVRYTVEPKLPADLLGIYVFLPKGGS